MTEQVKVGQIFTIERECEKETSYRWFLAKMSGGVILLDCGFKTENEDKKSKAGIVSFTFQAVKPGRAKIGLVEYSVFDVSDIYYEKVIRYRISK